MRAAEAEHVDEDGSAAVVNVEHLMNYVDEQRAEVWEDAERQHVGHVDHQRDAVRREASRDRIGYLRCELHEEGGGAADEEAGEGDRD